MREIQDKELNKTEDKLKEWIITAVTLGLCLVVTPHIAGFISPMFDRFSYGQMRIWFTELFTSIFWCVEIIIISIICKRKFGMELLLNPETKGKELSNKHMIILTVLAIGSILIISAQIGFEVKPFHDMGVKLTGYEFMNKLGELIKSVIKSMFMVVFIMLFQNIAEHFTKKDSRTFIWGGIILMITMGMYELCMGITTLPVTYLILNLIYGWIYLLTDRSMMKTFLFVLLIYIF